MKPRLVPAPLTQMDDWIYIWRLWRSRPELDRIHLEAVSILADRRDAEIMLAAQDWPQKSVHLAIRHGRNATWAEAIDVRQGSDRL